MVGGEVFILIEREAIRLRENAAYSGAMNDGGAQALRDQVRFYKYGRDGTMPPEWRKYQLQAERERDPDWQELVRLKRKFGEK